MRPLTLLIATLSFSWPQATQEPILDLSDRECRREVLIATIEDAHVYASCESDGTERIMHVSAVNMAPPSLGPLTEFSIGFCNSSVVAVSAQSDWIGKVQGEQHSFVTWRVPPELANASGVPSKARVGGFVVRLKPGWRRSRRAGASWGESKMVSQITTHDC
jgi:hypothetical protein